MENEGTKFTKSTAIHLKQPKTCSEQVKITRAKGFIVNDDADCITFLKQANYYRLSAYFLPFRKRDGTYFTGVNISRIQRIYNFDSQIRALLFQAIEQIEFYMRTTLSYYLANKYGTLGYLDKNTYSERHNADKFNEKVEQCIQENKRTLVVKHHQEKYGGQFPVWVIIEFFSMGMLSYCYGDLKSEDQKIIARNAFSSSSACINSWLRCITDLRNRCAHYSRLYFWTFPAIPLTPKGNSFRMDRKLFSQIMMLKYLYPDKNFWNTKFVIGIEMLIKEYLPDISLKHIGFPENWEALLRA